MPLYIISNMNIEKIKQYLSGKEKLTMYGNVVIFEISISNILSFASELRNNKNLRLKFITATDERKENGCFKIWYVFGAPHEHGFIIPFIELKNTEQFPSLSPLIHNAWNYERKIKTFFGLDPVGHQ